jgi:hypothetical protein
MYYLIRVEELFWLDNQLELLTFSNRYFGVSLKVDL